MLELHDDLEHDSNLLMVNVGQVRSLLISFGVDENDRVVGVDENILKDGSFNSLSIRYSINELRLVEII